LFQHNGPAYKYSSPFSHSGANRSGASRSDVSRSGANRSGASRSDARYLFIEEKKFEENTDF